MDIINVLLIILIFYMLYVISYSSVKNPTTEKYDSIRHQPRYNRNKIIKEKQIINDVISWDGSDDSGSLTKQQINPNLLDVQFHNDYRDVITAINNLVPEQKQLFNLPNIPVVYSEPRPSEVKNLISDFLHVLNVNLAKEVPDVRNKNSGWDEAITDPRIESGWDKVQKGLGLLPSLWNDPAGKSQIKLININYVQKYETDDELKYSCDIIIQKAGVDDQMILKTSFVQDKRPLRDENNFFLSKNVDMKVVIEGVFILGYLSHEGNDARLEYDNESTKYQDYNLMEKNQMTDPKNIQSILLEKYQQKAEEMNQFNLMLDEEGQSFHKTLPNLYDLPNVQATTTIFDDMNSNKIFT